MTMHLLASHADTAARVRIFGSLDMTVGGRPVEIRPGRPRRFVLALLLRAGQRVSLDTLLEQLWPAEQPKNPKNALQIVVSHVRKALDDAAGAGHLIETVENGYRLDIDRDHVDAFVFEDAVRSLSDVDDAIARLAAIDDALLLWRGDPLAEAAYESFAQPAIRRLLELRVAALEARAQTLLELGRNAEAIAMLAPLIDEYPLHERFPVLLMTALYRAGRQADALRIYDATRAVLRDELGIDPGPELRAMAQAVLDQSPLLTWVPAGPRLVPVPSIGACA